MQGGAWQRWQGGKLSLGTVSVVWFDSVTVPCCRTLGSQYLVTQPRGSALLSSHRAALYKRAEGPVKVAVGFSSI